MAPVTQDERVVNPSKAAANRKYKADAALKAAVVPIVDQALHEKAVEKKINSAIDRLSRTGKEQLLDILEGLRENETDDEQAAQGVAGQCVGRDTTGAGRIIGPAFVKGA